MAFEKNKVFLSSKIGKDFKELETARKQIAASLDARIFETYRFECEPAISRDMVQNYLSELAQADLCVFLLAPVEIDKESGLYKEIDFVSKNKIPSVFIFLVDEKMENPYKKVFYEKGFKSQYKDAKNYCELIKEAIDAVVCHFNKPHIIQNPFIKSLESIEEELKMNTEPSLDLSFFDFEEKDFAEKFYKIIDSHPKHINIKGFNKEETLYVVLFLLKSYHAVSVFIVRDENAWYIAAEQFQDSILIPFFETCKTIPVAGRGCTTIYIRNEYVSKSVLNLPHRLRSNLESRLINAFGID